MADQDQGRFDQTLLTGAEKALNDEGRPDLAAQLDKLFTEVKPGEKLSDAMAEYQARLGAMLGAEVNREVRNPNLPHLQAERAFRDAAKDHGITLPPAFDTVASDFHLQFPAKDAPTPPPKPAATDSASSKSGHAPMIVDNPDGTFTIQKAPPKDAKGDDKGLVIPPQVVVGPAQAMEIRQFDKMAEQDRNEYVAELVQGAEQVLTAAGQADQAAKVSKLFTTHLGNDQSTIGIVEFMSNLARARLADAPNVAKDHNAQRIEVEDALGVTLQKNHIELPDSFYTVMSNFHPKYPLQQ